MKGSFIAQLSERIETKILVAKRSFNQVFVLGFEVCLAEVDQYGEDQISSSLSVVFLVRSFVRSKQLD